MNKRMGNEEAETASVDNSRELSGTGSKEMEDN